MTYVYATWSLDLVVFLQNKLLNGLISRFFDGNASKVDRYCGPHLTEKAA